MPTVIERLSGSTGGPAQQLGVQVGAQVGALQQAIKLAGPLLAGKTPDVSTFIGSLGALRSPAFDGGGGFGGALSRALALVPTDLAAIVAPVGGRFTEMAALVEERLKPLLQDAVKVAQAIQQLLNLRLGCLDGIGGNGGNADPAPALPPAPGDPPPSGRVAIAAQQIAQLDGVLGALPNPIDASALLQLLLMQLRSKSRDTFFAINLPLVDDLLDPLQTLAAWAALDAAGVQAHMGASIDALSARLRDAAASPLAALRSTLDALAPQWRRAALSAAADAVAGGLTALDAALQAADEAAATAALGTLNTALDAYDALRIAMNGDVLPAIPALRGRLTLVTDTLLDGLTHLLVQLEPTNVAARVTSLIPPFQPVSAAAVEAARSALQPLIDWLRDLIVQLDFGVAQAEIAEVAAAARAIATDIESALTAVALKVESAFADVGTAISGIGLDALRNQLSGQVAQFGEQVRRDIGQAFAPARVGTGAAIGAVSDALDAFDPASLVAALQQVIDGIAGVLNGPDVQGAIGEVKRAVDAVVEALKSLSFAPVTAEVIALIEAMKKGLKAIIDKDLNDATKAALGAALSVLPGDLHPVTDPLVADFGKLVASGPLAVLASVQDAPQKLLDEIKRFEPAALVGDQLAAPYRTLLASAGKFKAAQLFAAADSELTNARRRLQQTASPGRALQPLRAPLQQLFAKLDAFSPAALLAPLTQAVQETIAHIVDASPVDEILATINGVFDSVREVLNFAQRIQSVADRVRQLFDALANADAQLDAWRDGLLAKVGDGTDAAVAAALAALTAALDGVRHADVLAAFDSSTAAVMAELDGLDGTARLSRIVSAYGRFATRVVTLPPSATKDAAQLVLTRFNPAQPLHSAPLRLAGDLRAVIGATRDSLVAQNVAWTDTVEGLANLRGVAAGSLHDLVAAAIEPALQPVRCIFRSAGNLAAPVNGVAQTLTDLVTTLTSRIDALVNGPGSLSAISGAVQEVVDTLRNIDLSFVGRSLDDVLNAVREQLRAIDPAQLADELDAEFAQALSGLSLDSIIPAADIAALDAAWQAVIAKLKQLDPGELVEKALQPVYDAAVLPLLDAFDLTPVFAALIDFLKSMAGELSDGLDEVNVAYQSLVALRPGGGVSASIGA